VTVCSGGGGITGRQRLVYRSVTNRLLVAIWLQQQITEDAPYFMLKYEGKLQGQTLLVVILSFLTSAMSKTFPSILLNHAAVP